MRIIFVPQFPSEMRYQEWWFTEFPKQFKAHGFDVLTLGEDYANMIKHRRSELDMFSPINQAIEFETEQIREYMMLDIQDDDILFLADISFPGFFANVLYHKECPKMYAFCHATSMNKLDYFQSRSYSKFPVESSHSILFDTVFVGSEYHQKKLQSYDIRYWKNTMVTYLPFPPMEAKIKDVKKTIDIMSASRPSPQKVDSVLEDLVEAHFSKIKRPVSSTWFNYYWNLNSAKILLITAFEDTFGYQIVDAVMNNCIPLARRDLAYPELLDNQFLYSTTGELMSKIDRILYQNDPVFQEPKLLCQEQMNKFYDVICEEMRSG